MAIRPIRLFPDPVLRTVAEPVGDVDASVDALVADMFDTMYHAGGVGLAAPQVGISRRIFVYDDGEGHVGALLDPEYTVSGEDSEPDYEGCLSVPEVGGDVERPLAIDLRGRDARGEEVAFHADGFLARICQHEIDHLDGVMFMQRLPAEARREAMGAIRTSEWFGHATIVGDLVFDDTTAALTHAAEIDTSGLGPNGKRGRR